MQGTTEQGAFCGAVDLVKSASQTFRVAGELNRSSVGQILSLPGNGSLDESAKEQAQIANCGKTEPAYQQERHGFGTIPVAAHMTGTAQQELSHLTDQQNACQHGHQTDIEPHVAIENMAEFMADYSLQFVPA